MDELEDAFLAFLEQVRGDRPVVEIRVRDIRDALGAKFIGDGRYQTSELTREVAALVKHYRTLGRLEWLRSGFYLYGIDRVEIIKNALTEVQPRSVARYRSARIPLGTLFADPDLLQAVAEQHFSSVAQLASSSTFLVMGGLNDYDFDLLNGLSF